MSVAREPLRRVAREDPALRATLRSRRELFYAEGADLSLDRPAHVRAGSGLAWLGEGAERRLVIAQDDASFLALLDASLQRVSSIALEYVIDGRRQFDATRGNKKQKLDLEACSVIRAGARDLVIAWGSGSLPARERLVVLENDEARIVDAHALYAQLRAERALAGSELNIEGAVSLEGERVRLFQRGNGAPRDGFAPIDATCDLDARELLAWLDDPSRPPPSLRDVVQWQLGRVRDVRLTFTDACAGPEGSIVYLAAAEASPDAIEDGEVVGVAVGRIDSDGDARWTLMREPDGTAYVGKCEGIAWAPGAEGRRALVVVDRDDPNAPSELCEVDLEGFSQGA